MKWKNYNLYRSFASFFAIEGYRVLEEYYQKRATEEKLHHDWCFQYLTDGDYKFKYPSISENMETFSELIDPFKLTVDREILTTEMIYKIYEAALEEKDLWLHLAIWKTNQRTDRRRKYLSNGIDHYGRECRYLQ